MLGRPALGAALLLAVCLAIYWPWLGSGGFHSTEAHRAVPAYEMLDHARSLDAWLVPRMFEQPYLRKPPGMPWAIAGMSALLGETVFAARAVSALASTLMAFVSFAFAWRWFGRGAALPAGLACALMPGLWESGRAAEIEALNTLGTQLAALFLIDALVHLPGLAGVRAEESRRSPGRGVILSSLGAAAGTVWFALAKGPASVPVVVGVIAAACVVRRSFRPLAGVVWITLGVAGAAVGLLAWMIAGAASRESIAPVTQSPDAFMFEPGMLLAILTLPFAAFIQMLPASFALLFPWGPDARGEAEAGSGGWGWAEFRLARGLALAWLIAVGVFMVFGVRNPRYTLPAAGLLPPLAGAYLSGMVSILVQGEARGGWMRPARIKVGRVLTLGRPMLLGVLLISGAWVYIHTAEGSRRGTSATGMGEEIAADLSVWLADRPGSVVVIADDAIEARPELLLSLEQSLRETGSDIRVLWRPGLGGDLTEFGSSPHVIALVRGDAPSQEKAMVESGNTALGDAELICREGGYAFHKYRAFLYLVKQ